MTAVLRTIAQSAYILLHSKDTQMSTPIYDQLKREEETRKISHLDPDLAAHRRRLKVAAALVALASAALLIALVVSL